MPSLIKEDQDGILGRRQWWAVGKGKALVSFGPEGCGVWFYDLPTGRSEDIGGALIQAGHPITLEPSIDCELIVCPEANLEQLLLDVARLIKSGLSKTYNH